MRFLKRSFIIVIMIAVKWIFLPETCHAVTSSEFCQQKEDTLKLPESVSKEELEHFRRRGIIAGHAGGPDYSAGNRARSEKVRHYQNEIERFGGEKIGRGQRYLYNPKLMDQAWTLMLHKQGYITTDEARTVLSGLEKVEVGGERKLKMVLDEHHASIPYFGKTMQEPLSHMWIREKQLDVIDAIHSLLGVLLNKAERHSETIMPGMSHMAHAQPITYGSYLLALHDGISRGLEYLELAYKHTNQNNAGCGATSGSGFYVDRDYITELLGFDETKELTYDAEPGQDWVMSTLYGLSNIMLVVSRTAMDHSIWGMDGYSTHLLEAGGSQFMPHKAHAGSEWEHIRISVNNILGTTYMGVNALNKEPLMDVLTIYQAAYRSPNVGAIGALCEAEMTLGILEYDIENLRVDREKLLQLTRDGWGCTTDLVAKLVLENDLGVRQAHRICGVMVRMARVHRKLKPYELTGAMLDEAARLSDDPEPHLTTEELREIMDPVKFIERHNNLGEPNPNETIRMVNDRRMQLKESQQRNVLRRERVEKGFEILRTEIDNILISDK
ncbi:MAG: lyase family protein [Bacteroidota bacterium]